MTRVGKRVWPGGGVEEGRPPGCDGGGGGVARHRHQAQELVSSAAVGVIVVERGPDNISRVTGDRDLSGDIAPGGRK